MNPLKPYMDLIKGAGWLCLFGFFFWIGGVREERSWLAKENKALAKAIEDVAKADAKRVEAEGKLAKALAKKPQTGKKVNDAVTANPTSPQCVVPDDVVAGMQDGIDAGKDATR